MRRVAESAGTTTRAVYTLFGDKNGLLRAVFRQMAEVMRRHHERVPEMEDPFEEIQRLAAAYRAAAREQPNLYDYYYRCMAPDGVITEDDVALAFRSFDRVLRTLHRIIASGAFGHGPRSRPAGSSGLSCTVWPPSSCVASWAAPRRRAGVPGGPRWERS